ncbi:MAG TPA: MtrB/PioB family decaheme-associated outer membrane protein [Dissulfurispiraceae bacterium]|nr:MtrB/PioB family decaheme-associated outer membrane protein [Dissulfurispiraceae bacterium]
MINRVSILTFSLILLSSVSAYCAESSFEGDLGLTGVVADINGNRAKFNEYGDLKTGVYGNVRLRYDSDLWFLRFKASDLGYDTQNYRLEGGAYGYFKAYFSYDELPHNFTDSAKSFYRGVGTNNLTYSGSPTGPITIPVNPNTWPSTFDYEIKRKTFETGLKVDALKPFYLTTSFSQEKRDGIKPNWAGVSPGSAFIEIPEPVDYTTNIFNIEAGYAQRPLFAAVYFIYSTFENANDMLFFRNPLGTPAGVTDIYSLPPDNTYYKVGFKGSVQLPLNSKLSANLSESRAKSDTNLLDTKLATATVFNLSDSIFNGRVDTTNLNIALTSNPLQFVTGKIFYKYYNRHNKSDEISYQNTSGGAIVSNDLFSYHKNTYGADFLFKLPANLTLGAAYTRIDTSRDRADIPETRDNITRLTLKWNGVDFIVPKITYEYLRRNSDQAPGSGLEVVNYTFDVAAKHQNMFKAGVEIYPLANLNFDIEYKYKKDKYTNSPEGLQSTQSDGIDFSAGYTVGTFAQLSAYMDYERIKSYQFQLPTAANNWGLRLKDTSIGYGIGAEVYLVPKKLTLILQHDYIKSNGLADFSYFNASALTGGRTNDNIDINNWDDYSKMSYTAKLRYWPIKALTLTAGYAYERYRYNDAQYDGYDIAAIANAPAASNRAYLTGAYANPNYQAHVGFIGVSYHY